MRKLTVLSLLFMLLCGVSHAQADSDVLFSIADREVTVGEFRYIYEKTNADKATYSRQSLEEYLDLYQRFKLKVHRAYAMQLDTVKSLQQELAGYRRQLAENYLMDRAVTDRLAEELYQRRQQDVEISHILFPLSPSAAGADTVAVYEEALSIRKQLTPANFATLAQQFSKDQYSKDKGGRIGFLTAPLPNGLYQLENLIYSAKENTILGPVRTQFGLHLVLIHGKRAARGEIEAAHILIRKPDSASEHEKARQRAEEIASLLRNEQQPFEKLAATMSEDEKTAKSGGYVGFFGINRYETAIEDAAFALQADGDISAVVESRVGYHIIKRISKKANLTFAEERPLLISKVKADSRYQVATDALLQQIRQRAGLQENKTLLMDFAASLADSSFLNLAWKAPLPTDERSLFSIGKEATTTLGDFQRHLQSLARQRAARARSGNSQQAVMDYYQEFLNVQLLAYEESKLEENYPDFRALMREYEEGILLFEATKLEVWDKASEDSIGLVQFFEKNQDKYFWTERASVTRYTIFAALADKVAAIRALAPTTEPEALVKMFPSGSDAAGLRAQTDTYERQRLEQMEAMEWKVGAISESKRDERSGQVVFHKIEEILPGGPKELDEARGYVIADYQDQLEKDWVASLAAQHPVKLRKKTFEKMVK